ncbi:phasin family protein [Rhodospirillaceae bacterium SYSU D60014]|uniref:phasin family protein n=1 Tax=Virgifigura deserti TaxID=2268457 RepID=UPI000E669801
MAARTAQRAAKIAGDVWSSNTLATQTALDLWAMTTAGLATIGYRLPMIAQALATPGDADHRELHRMGFEKLEAATDSGQALARGWTAMQRSLTDGMIDQTRLATRCFAAVLHCRTTGQAAATQQRYAQASIESGFAVGIRLTELTVRMTATALDPLHSRATKNARRLARAAARAERAAPIAAA